MVSKRKEATNTMMVDLLAKFGVDTCKTSLEFISPPPVITFFFVRVYQKLSKKSLLNRMDLNKKSGTIQLFTTEIKENVFLDIQNFIVLKYFQPAKKYFNRIDGT